MCSQKRAACGRHTVHIGRRSAGGRVCAVGFIVAPSDITRHPVGLALYSLLSLTTPLVASLLVMRRYAASVVRLPQSVASSVAVTRAGARRKYSVQAQQQKKLPSSHPQTLQTNDAYFNTPSPAKPPARPDPYKLVASELQQLRETLLNLLGSSHPSLTEIAKYYFLHPSKQLRPLLVLLFSQATNGLGSGWQLKKWAAECEGAGGRAEELDRPLTRADVLNDWNPNMPDHTASFETSFSLRPPCPPHQVPHPPPFPPALAVPTVASPLALLPTQIRLAQIVEMIHVASLLHDDVIDKSPLRRGAASAPAAFGNKLSVLGGDFLLGRTSAALSRLGENEVVELIASVIANLVEGEILQLKAVHADELGIAGLSPTVGRDHWNIYLQKTYLKTASLMAKGARAAVILGGCKEGEVWKEVAYAYGRNLGIAFQVSSRVRMQGIPFKFTLDSYSLWTIFLTTRLVRPPSGSQEEPTSSWVSRLDLPCSHGRNIPRWVHSSDASSGSQAM